MALSVFLLIISFLGCSESKKDKAFDEFNAGVSISLDAANAMENENYELAEKLNKEAISKFENTLKIDSEHKGAPSALGHSYYLINDYQKGIEWYEKANKIDSTISINHLEHGLCKINNGLGKVKTGKHISSGMKSINYAIQLEQSDEMKEFAVYSLFDIGVLAIESNEPFVQHTYSHTNKTHKNKVGEATHYTAVRNVVKLSKISWQNSI